ncbi:MAG: LPS export ABC transporter periplasmic protein LptC [Rhizobiaceae bacterium]|nr:LPS export ABC transporter periplasmic protein LptC [Rhizobiaceae bacterium]MCV0405000.1 LPS export ABC transporter periplasmic protein LptC [Rhizobiaceae bacterium]
MSMDASLKSQGRDVRVGASARGDDAYRRAQRHSSRVRVLKFLVPLVAAVMAIGFAGYTWLATPGDISVDLAGSGIRDGKLVMANPKLEGFTRDDLPYTVSAARAIQDMKGDAPVVLEEIDARLPIDAGNWASVDARSGLYDEAGGKLDITSEMTVTTTDGMIARFRSASIDIESGGLVTSDPVDVTMSDAHIAADSMRVTENGKVFVFERRVKVTMNARATNLTRADQ